MLVLVDTSVHVRTRVDGAFRAGCVHALVRELLRSAVPNLSTPDLHTEVDDTQVLQTHCQSQQS